MTKPIENVGAAGSAVFEDFAGNHRVVQRLREMIDQNRFPQAIVLEGPKGSGRHTLAKIIAAAAVCTAESPRPCGICTHCAKAVRAFHPDIREVSGTGAARSLSVSVVREIRADAYIYPNEASRKVYILSEAQSMSEQAQNAVLKVLEEPPGFVLFLFTCLSRSQLLETVLSRCVTFTLGPVNRNEAVPWLLRRFSQVSAEDAAKALEEGGGLLGRASDTLSGTQSEENKKTAGQLCTMLMASSELDLLECCALLERDKSRQRIVLDHVGLLLRDACVLSAGGRSMLSAGGDIPLLLCQQFARAQLMDMFEIVTQCRALVDRGTNGPLLMTVLCARLRKASGA